MSTAESTESTQSQLACPSCAAVNAETAKYCFSCGSPLWENCASCNTPTRIGQKFCGDCGHNLAADVDQRLRKATMWMDLAREAFERFDYEEAIAVANRVMHRDDPRFAAISDEAEQLVEQSQQAHRQWRAKVEDVRGSVDRAAEAGDFERVIELLSPLPTAALGEALARSLSLARSRAASVGELSVRLRRATETKDLMTAGRLIDELLLLRPNHKEYAKLATKIAHALLRSAERRFQKGLYADAIARLEATPQMARGAQEYSQLRSRIEDAEWLAEQISNAPFATPTLVRLAKRLTQTAPPGAYSPKLLSRLTATIRTITPDRHSLYSAWRNPPRGWSGAPIALLNRPQHPGSNREVLEQHPTRFTVAIGLALQGVGLASFEGQLSSAPRRTGLKHILRRHVRASAAWGIDAGTSALRAVRLERATDGVRIADAFLIPLKRPLCRTSDSVEAAAGFGQALHELAAKISASGDVPVWANLAGRETLGRFLTLPPAPEKLLVKMVEQEIGSGFPVAEEELRVAHAITGHADDGTRRAIIVAARRDRVEKRERVFEEAGIKLSGLQADPLALHNFVHHELREYLVSRPAAGTAPEAIVLLDGGASGTTYYMATSNAFWFRFVDGGGEDLTARLAAACESTPSEAELLKINPAAIPSLRPAMNAVESEMHQSARRLDQHHRSANEFLGEVRLKRIFCTGGTPLMHGWLRHVLQASP